MFLVFLVSFQYRQIAVFVAVNEMPMLHLICSYSIIHVRSPFFLDAAVSRLPIALIYYLFYHIRFRFSHIMYERSRLAQQKTKNLFGFSFYGK